jgi:hypothetical protein
VIARRDPRGLAILVLIVVLAGATAFGLWHVVFGGLVRGNPGAAAFGAVLAVLAGGLLRAAIVIDRRLRRG